jgi:hypothetical protein
MTTTTSKVAINGRHGKRFLAAVAAVIVPLSLVVSGSALITGNLTLAQLGGFGIDGNYHLDTGETYDWANAGGSGGPTTCGGLAFPGSAGPLGTLGLYCANDKPTGTSDNSFSGHEQDLSIQAVCGSIPNNKSDLTNFYVASQAVSGFANPTPVHSLLYLGWTRVTSGGSADMDFEFNQLAQDPNLALTTCPAGNGTTIAPNRSDGDLLVEYQFGGNTIDIKLAKWITNNSTEGACATSQAAPCWGAEISLSSANKANGAINDSNTTDSFSCLSPNNKTVSGCINNELSGGVLQPTTFGEAGIDLSAALSTTSCETFGSAYLKSRSSAVFTDAVKDYIAPVPVHVTNCVTPPVTTSLSRSTASLGQTVTDTATVSNFLGPNPPGGTVAFNVYSGTGSSACVAANRVETVPTGANPNGTSGDSLTAGAGTTATATETITAGTTLSPGHYEVQAVYTGDGSTNLGSSSACGSEPLQINKAQPTITTDDTSFATSLIVGSAATIGDTATFSNLVSGVTPTGSVTFTLFSNAGCTTAASPAVSGSEPVGTAFSTSWTSQTLGTYYWGISYPGDSNYLPVPASGVQCGGTNETLTVGQATPSLSSQISLEDTATITGGDSPGGTISFQLWDNATCGGTSANEIAHFDNVPIVSGTASTVGRTPTAGSTLVSSGKTYSWKVIYNGDTNNASVTIGCTDASHETAAISYAP